MRGLHWFLCGSAALLVVEVGLRLNYEAVPSLSVSLKPFVPEGRPSVAAPGPDLPLCRQRRQVRPEEAGEGTPPPLAWARTLSGEGEELVLFVVGDSGAMGSGVEPEETYAYGIAGHLAERTGRPVRLLDLGYNAASYCGYLQELHRHLDRETPDLVVLQLFADDLEQQALILTGGVLRADPSQLQNAAAKQLLGHIYVANWVWWKGLSWAVVRSTDGGEAAPPWVDQGPRLIPTRTMENFGASMIHLQERLQDEGVTQLNFLISPAGWPLCPSQPGATSECGWLRHDLSMMAERLNEVGIPWVDLRNIWGSDKTMVQPLEMRFYREQGRLPIHPDAVGHSRISEELWPSVESVWSVAEKASRGR